MVNSFSRALIRDESLRKRIVGRFYAFRAAKVNAGAPFAKRTVADMLDWRATMKYAFHCSHEVYRGNTFYGIGGQLRNYAGSATCVKAAIEHGVYFGSYTNTQELEDSGLPCLVTFGPKRLAHIRRVSKVPVIQVGPYIAYASDYLTDDELYRAHRSLGRILLVFPSHSIDRAKAHYEVAAFLGEIDRIRRDESIDTVLICLYYRDILNGAAEPYETHGLKVVTAGYREDSLFLARQRSLIRLSDLTMSNSVGTHVGYCAYLGKPHYVFRQEVCNKSDSVVDGSEFIGAFASQRDFEKAEVAAAFSCFTPMQTPEQKEILERYWGFSQVRSRDSMASFLEACEEAYGYPASERQSRLRQRTRIDPIHGESLE